MTNEQKTQVRDALTRYTAGYPTQAVAAASLQGISPATLSQIKNNNWELISEKMWHHIARQVGFYTGAEATGWQPADTGAHLLLRILMGDAQHFGMAYGIAMAPGLGKTFTASHYMQENGYAYHMPCSAGSNRRSFLAALLALCGIHTRGTVPQMMAALTTHLTQAGEALLILDDVHLLKDRVLQLVVILANELAGKMGIILMGDNMLRTRIIDGVMEQRPGYDDLFRTIGRRFVTLASLAPHDAALVCRANNLNDEGAIAHIMCECATLHEVKDMVQHYTTAAKAA